MASRDPRARELTDRAVAELRSLPRLFLRLRGVRLTRDGWWFCTVVAGIAVVALNTGNNLLYLLLAMLLSLVVASFVMAEVSLRGVVPRRQPPPRVHATHPFLMGIVLRNDKRRFPSFSVEVEDLCDDQVVDKRCYFLKIPSGRTQQTSYRHTLARRGRYVFTAFRISTKFPFALFRASRYVEHRSEVVVYPALLPLQHWPQALTVAAGELAMGRLGRRGNFHALRDYRTGDDVRDIHWRSSARRQRLMVREHEVEAVQQVTLILDNALTPAEQREPRCVEALERVISWGASLGVFYLEHGYAVRLCVRAAPLKSAPAQPQPLLFGPAGIGRLLTTLALLETVPPEVPFQALPPVAPGPGPASAPGPHERSDCLLVTRPGVPAPREVALGHVVEAA